MTKAIVLRDTQNPIADAWEKGIVAAARKGAQEGRTVIVPKPSAGILLALTVTVVKGNMALGKADDGQPYALDLGA